MQEYSSMDNIIPGLFLGDMEASENLELLHKHNITHIIVAGNLLTKHYPTEYTYHQLEVEDAEHEDMISHFRVCIDFIEKAIENKGNIFVHCAAGISRSPTIVIAYLMFKNRWDYDTTYKFTKRKRWIVLPNPAFQEQLHLFHKLDYIVNNEHPDLKKYLEDLQAKERVYY